MQNQKETWADLRKRARWDRIGGAFAVLFLLFVLMVSGITSCVRRVQKAGTEEVNALETTPPLVTEAPTQEPDNSEAVFLSPSTQEENLYACDDSISEETAMWRIARKVQELLEADGYVVYLPGEDDNPIAKVKQGNHLKCGAYVAMHSNSSGSSGGGHGTECFYNEDVPGSLALAESIYNRVAVLTPTDDRGIKNQYQRDLYEVNNNTGAVAFLEVEFHDDVTTSRWILNHVDDVAQAIKDGIVAYLNNKKYGLMSETTEPSEGEYIYPEMEGEDDAEA